MDEGTLKKIMNRTLSMKAEYPRQGISSSTPEVHRIVIILGLILVILVMHLLLTYGIQEANRLRITDRFIMIDMHL